MAKRVPAEEPTEKNGRLTIVKIREVKPWFVWTLCRICGHEFRREPMWELTVDWWQKLLAGGGCAVQTFGWETDRSHLCSKCAPTYQDAKAWFYKNCRKYYTRAMTHKEPYPCSLVEQASAS